MNTYEFWNDMDKIYEAIVAYQEKTIEFNKQFINPWVKLGNVFDKSESNEEIIAHKNAIEINPKNAQNWYELANIYSRFGYFDKSIQAYQKTIDLGFESGELYKNLALAYVMTAKHQDAIPVFQKALSLLENDKDKAVIWNHLGNIYRKLDNYEMALQAFQQADQLETGKTPIVDEPHVAPVDEEITEEVAVDVEEAGAPQLTEKPAAVMDATPAPEEGAPDEDKDTTLNDFESDEPVAEQSDGEPESVQAVPTVNELELPVAEEDKADEEDFEFDDDDMPVVLEVDFSEGMVTDEIEEAVSQKEPVIEGMAASEQDEIPTSAEATQEESEAEEAAPEEELIAEAMAALEEDEAPTPIEAVREESEGEAAIPEEEPVVEFLAESDDEETPISVEAVQEEPEAEEAAPEETVAEFLSTLEEDEESAFVETAEDESEESVPEDKPVSEFLATLEEDDDAPVSVVETVQEEVETEEAAPEDEPVTVFLATSEEDEMSEENVETSESNEEEVKVSQESYTTAPLSAYAEYLEDNAPVSVGQIESKSDETETIALAPAEVEVTNSEVNMEVGTNLTIEMDSKNAHVWNELGNVYFNAGSYDDAITAYSKAIQLDAQFAWPYTNLALSYVHKERLADAISLYQRGIELFSNEKDKAVAWNRLGNVYRRMNDYENAIAAYQRADELDPDNTAVTQQSRFSLFGSEKVDQEAEYSV